MKIQIRTLCLSAALAWFLTLSFAAIAQEKPAAVPAPQPEPATPAVVEAPKAPVATPPAQPSEPAKSELRHLDTESALPAAKTDESPDDEKMSSGAADDPDAEQPKPVVPAKKSKHTRSLRVRSAGHTGNERVSFWSNSTLAAGESADAVVSIFGNSTSAGKVSDAVVSVVGSSTSSGDVGDGVVSVLGNTRVTDGTVGDAAVAVLGNTYINTHVKGEAVAVLGQVQLGPKAEVDGDVVSIGGVTVRDPQAVVHGQVNNIAIGGHAGGWNFEWLQSWVSQCLAYGRLLAFGPHLMWAWWIAIGFLAFYVVLGLLFPRGAQRCVETLEEKPGFSILTAFLVTLLAPLAVILLLITIVGAPALIFCLIAAGIFGKVVMLAWLGRRITKLFGGGLLTAPAVTVLVGGVLVLLLYTVPVVGFLIAKLLSWLGLGVVVYTIILNQKNSRAAARAAAAAATPLVASVSVDAAGVATTAGVAPASPTTGEPPVVTPPVLTTTTTLPRAGFWIRLGASALDAVLVALALHLLPSLTRPNFLLAMAAYCVVLWALKGSTVGGIVCGLKVVRIDDRPVDWVTALVRALGAFLSLVIAGLGFIWVAFDDQKQSWHDKIAGTTVVVIPKGMSLL